MAAPKPWYRVEGCQPREDLRLNKPLKEDDFAVNLDHIRRGESHPDYVKPHLFFARTFMTGALKELSAGVIGRLSGEKSETAAVYNMATQFGGGKTHALATLYHLARGGEAARSWPGVDGVLVAAGVKSVPKADVAVVVGTEFDPITGRRDGDGPVRKTIWGEVAWQLGGEKAFKVVAEHEARVTAPGGDVIRAMLDASFLGGPCLILLDELVNYVGRGRAAGLRDQSLDFLQNLSETARARSNVVLCVSIPKSKIHEVSPEDIEDHARLQHMLDRLGKGIVMSADVEISEIIRRRLFDWQGFPKEGEAAAQEYAAWVRDNAGALSGIDPDRAYEEFKAAYPFHPAALSVFQRKWQSLPSFQRTRGVLRLLALWVARAFQEDHRQQFPDSVIGLGTAPFDDPKFRVAVFDQLGNRDLEGPATTDIAGSANAHAVRLDKEATDAIKRSRLHQKAAASIFFESNGGQMRTEAALGEIKAAVGGPNVNLADIDHVLEGLSTSCFYLTSDRNRYRFSTSPNVNKILTDRRAAVQPKQIDDLLRREIESVFKSKPKDVELDVRTFPERPADVPDRPVLTFVVLHPEQRAEAGPTKLLMEKIVKEHGTTGRVFKAALVFVGVDSSAEMTNAARDVLAWREIDEDTETKARLDDNARKQLAHSVRSSKAALEDAIWRAYRYVYLQEGSGDLRQIEMGRISRNQGNAGSPLENILNRLAGDDITVSVPSPTKLTSWWPAALSAWPTRGVRDAFFSTPKLPRLRQPDLIKRTIADGVSRGEFGYAAKKGSNDYKLIAFHETYSEADVDLSDDYVLVKPDEARKLKEPPRLATLTITPDGKEIGVGEAVHFAISAADQYGAAFTLTGVEWMSSGGTIDQAGRFSGKEPGYCTVTATAGGVQARATVRIRATAEVSKPTPQVGPQLALWTGEVPAQKWMNLYTKVLSKFAQTPGLKIKVSFETPADTPAAQAKVDEARAALKELGLDDGISTGP